VLNATFDENDFLLLPFYFCLKFMFQRVFDPLLTLVYPQACHVCENSVESSEDGIACSYCWKKTSIFSGAETLCAKCGAFLRPESSDFQTFCRRCDEHFYDSATAVGIYEYALAASVLHLKRESFVAKRLQKTLVSRFQNTDLQNVTLIIPVPLSKKRLLERGFNQAAVISKILAEKFGTKSDEQSLARNLHTPMHRAGMDGKARAASVENAFEVKRPKLIEGEKILLVDDVYTSGATVSNCAETLKKSGAEKVYVFTLARTL